MHGQKKAFRIGGSMIGMPPAYPPSAVETPTLAPCLARPGLPGCRRCPLRQRGLQQQQYLHAIAIIQRCAIRSNFSWRNDPGSKLRL